MFITGKFYSLNIIPWYIGFMVFYTQSTQNRAYSGLSTWLIGDAFGSETPVYYHPHTGT
jgi:hypothetical protein